MRRLARLIGLFWSTAVAGEMEYRVNFALAVLSSAGGLLGALFGLSLFFGDTDRFAGWSWLQALVVLGVFTLLDGLTSTLLVPNLGRIVRHVRMGTLDFVLLKPVDAQLWLSTRDFSPWGLPDVLLGLGLVIWAGVRLSVSPTQALLALVPTVASCVILYSLWFVLATMSIWFVKIHNVTEVLKALVAAGRYPMSAYPAAYRVFFTLVVPVAFLTTVPAETFIGRGQPAWIVGSVLLALLLFAASRAFFRFALRFYTSASS